VYDTPKLKPILQNTYGVIVYQEQVMEIVRELAGFTMGQSDTIRKAMGKKKKAILEEYKPYFIHGSGDAVDEHTGKPLNINGCMANGISEETAEAIWQKMNNFASYAFNKSHAAVYSVITMTCAYLKHYHKVGFMCGIINAFLDNANKLKSYISVALRMGIEILPPDINKSLKTFTVEGDAIRYGLCGLKGISKNADVIISEREKNGEYKGLQNFCDRLYDKKVNKKNLESLIFTGCLDTFVGTRRGKESVIEKALKSAKKNGADTSSSQLSFFEELKISREIEIPNIEEYPKEILLRKEKEFSGMYITEHPLDIYSNVLLANGVTDISTLIDEDGNMAEGKYTFAGIISDIHFRITKKDSRTMATFNVEDRTESINAVIFPNDFENYSHLLSEGNLIAVKGTVQNDDNFGPQLLVSSIALLKDLAEAKTVYGICVRLNSLSESDRFLEVISPYLGGNLRVYVQADKQLYEYNTLKVYENNSMFLALQDAFGVDNVKYLK
jgi:DNA polymerase-3 subunit alpha